MNLLALIPLKAWLVLGAVLALCLYIGWLQHVHKRDQFTIHELQAKVDKLKSANDGMANDIKIQNAAIEDLAKRTKAYAEKVDAANAVTASYRKRLEVALALIKDPPPDDPAKALEWLSERNNNIAGGK